MKKAKKILVLVCCAALLVCISVGSTIAYLTSTDEVKNTFTVGKVAITMDEMDVNVYGEPDGEERVKSNEYKLIPGHTYTKDPTIHVTEDSEDCWLFVIVKNGVEDIEGITDDAPLTIAEQLEANGWVSIGSGADFEHYAYWPSKENKDACTKLAGKDVKVFEYFTVNGAFEGGEENEDRTVVVTAYAMQADGFGEPNGAWDAAFGAQN